MSESIERDVKALREALGAGPTDGPWRKYDDHGIWALRSTGKSLAIDFDEADCEYIVACSPDRIKRVLDALEQAQVVCGKSYLLVASGVAAEQRLSRAVELLQGVRSSLDVPGPNAPSDWIDFEAIDAFLKEQP